MLKGHLQIDLHNEITGENKRIEQDARPCRKRWWERIRSL